MPLPDERKREGVSSLIARFQNLADADKAEKQDEARRAGGSRSSVGARYSLEGRRPSLDGNSQFNAILPPTKQVQLPDISSKTSKDIISEPLGKDSSNPSNPNPITPSQSKHDLDNDVSPVSKVGSNTSEQSLSKSNSIPTSTSMTPSPAEKAENLARKPSSNAKVNQSERKISSTISRQGMGTATLPTASSQAKARTPSLSKNKESSSTPEKSKPSIPSSNSGGVDGKSIRNGTASTPSKKAGTTVRAPSTSSSRTATTGSVAKARPTASGSSAVTPFKTSATSRPTSTSSPAIRKATVPVTTPSKASTSTAVPTSISRVSSSAAKPRPSNATPSKPSAETTTSSKASASSSTIRSTKPVSKPTASSSTTPVKRAPASTSNPKFASSTTPSKRSVITNSASAVKPTSGSTSKTSQLPSRPSTTSVPLENGTMKKAVTPATKTNRESSESISAEKEDAKESLGHDVVERKELDDTKQEGEKLMEDQKKSQEEVELEKEKEVEIKKSIDGIQESESMENPDLEHEKLSSEDGVKDDEVEERQEVVKEGELRDQESESQNEINSEPESGQYEEVDSAEEVSQNIREGIPEPQVEQEEESRRQGEIHHSEEEDAEAFESQPLEIEDEKEEGAEITRSTTSPFSKPQGPVEDSLTTANDNEASRGKRTLAEIMAEADRAMQEDLEDLEDEHQKTETS